MATKKSKGKVSKKKKKKTTKKKIIMKPIVYKGFKFPNNPETTGFKCDRTYIEHKYPGQTGKELEDFGPNAMIISGSGIFYGSGCYKTWRKLLKQFNRKGVGKVSHPVYTGVKRGLMTSLTGDVNAEKNVIHYTFEIVADTVPRFKENVKKYRTNTGSSSTSGSSTVQKTYNVGDIVNFHGGTHYFSSYPTAKGYPANAGRARITLGPDCAGNGHAHPYHLIHVDNTSNVYGWVDVGTFD